MDRGSLSLLPPRGPLEPPRVGLSGAQLVKDKRHGGSQPFSAHAPLPLPWAPQRPLPSREEEPPPRKGNRAAPPPGSFSQWRSLCPSDWPLERAVPVGLRGERHRRRSCAQSGVRGGGAPPVPADPGPAEIRGCPLLPAPAPRVLPLTGAPRSLPRGASPRRPCLFDNRAFPVVVPMGRASAGP